MFNIFLNTNLSEVIKENIIYNIETILVCFGLDRYYYKKYYYPVIYKDTPIRNRQKSLDAARRFRNTFKIDQNIIKDEELIKKLDKSDNDINKVFQLMFG